MVLYLNQYKIIYIYIYSIRVIYKLCTTELILYFLMVLRILKNVCILTFVQS